jgi:hypothetical protein
MNIARRIIGENHYRDRGSPILPIGTVNLTTGANQMFGVIWNGWEEDPKAVNILLAARSYPGAHPGTGGAQPSQMRVVHSSGSVGEKEGDVMRLIHDQTRRPIGDEWTVVGSFPHTKEGLAQLKAKSGKSSLSFATFK